MLQRSSGEWSLNGPVQDADHDCDTQTGQDSNPDSFESPRVDQSGFHGASFT